MLVIGRVVRMGMAERTVFVMVRDLLQAFAIVMMAIMVMGFLRMTVFDIARERIGEMGMMVRVVDPVHQRDIRLT